MERHRFNKTQCKISVDAHHHHHHPTHPPNTSIIEILPFRRGSASGILYYGRKEIFISPPTQLVSGRCWIRTPLYGEYNVNMPIGVILLTWEGPPHPHRKRTSYVSCAPSLAIRQNPTPPQYLNPPAYGVSIRWGLSKSGHYDGPKICPNNSNIHLIRDT